MTFKKEFDRTTAPPAESHSVQSAAEHGEQLGDPCLKVVSCLTKHFNLCIWLSDDGLAGGGGGPDRWRSY